MRTVNKVIIIGNLTRNPEMKTTQNGQTITTFGIATNREWVTQEGDKRDSAEFHECVAWAKLGEICNTYLRKGKLVYIEGYLKTRSWETEEGDKRFKTEIVVQDMIMLDKRSHSDEGGQREDSQESTPAEAEDSEEAPAVEEEEEGNVF